MGKVKCKKSRNRGPRPSVVPSVKESEVDMEGLELREFSTESNSLESIIEKLRSLHPEDRECGATIIANEAERPDFILQIIENDVIKIMAPLLLDRNLSVRHTVAGSLRNLSSFGGLDVSKAMVDQDIMTPLAFLFKQYKTPAAPLKCPDGIIDSKSEIFLEACHLLRNLCESSTIAVDIFNQEDIFSILIPYVNIKIFSLETVLAVVQCLYTVVEDNSDACQRFSDDSVLAVLLSLCGLSSEKAEHVLLRNLAAGMTLCISSSVLEKRVPSPTYNVMVIIDETLQVPLLDKLEMLSGAVFSLKEEKQNSLKNVEDVEHMETDLTTQTKQMEYLLQAKQITLESLTNLCCSDEGSDWDDADSSDVNDDTYMQDELEAASRNSSSITLSEVHEYIANKDILHKVMMQNVILDDVAINELSAFPEGKNTLKRLRTVRSRALLCINNIIQVMDIDEIGSPAEIFQLWQHLLNVMFTQTDPSDNELLEAATSSVRAVILKLAETDCSTHFNQITEADLNQLFNICKKSEDLGVKVNIVRSVATVGCIISTMKHSNSQDLITAIGSFLTDTCTSSSDLWVLAETLDAIFDVFAEDDLDVIAKKIHLVETLQHLLPILKGKIKQQRKSLGRHLPIIMTAKTNLLGFIKYKTEFS